LIKAKADPAAAPPGAKADLPFASCELRPGQPRPSPQAFAVHSGEGLIPPKRRQARRRTRAPKPSLSIQAKAGPSFCHVHSRPELHNRPPRPVKPMSGTRESVALTLHPDASW
jgi:hypothetical protein